MNSKLFSISIVTVLMVWAISLPVFAQGPNFSNPAIFADGEMWATKGLNPFPAPNGKNNQSFDMLFIFTNGDDGQLPVSEAGPRNPDYNGGRWNAYSATWMDDFVEKPIVKSYAELTGYVADGYLTVSPANLYFECPLLPLKE